MQDIQCYCCSKRLFKNCCEPYLLSKKTPHVPEELMRSRYSAYATHNIEYLIATTHPSERINYSIQSINEWATSNNWLKLEIITANQNQVEFKAYYSDKKNSNDTIIHHERSNFVFENNKWFYVDGVFF